MSLQAKDLLNKCFFGTKTTTKLRDEPAFQKTKSSEGIKEGKSGQFSDPSEHYMVDSLQNQNHLPITQMQTKRTETEIDDP